MSEIFLDFQGQLRGNLKKKFILESLKNSKIVQNNYVIFRPRIKSSLILALIKMSKNVFEKASKLFFVEIDFWLGSFFIKSP
jgi:hypothetical protein